MGRKRLVEENQPELQPIRRALDPETRQNQLIALSENLAEKQLREGTASAQVICHYLKLGTVEKQLELEKLKAENALLNKKVEAIDQQMETSTKYIEAIEAMKKYSGHMGD